MGDKPISFRDKNGNFVSAADVWNEEKLEKLFNKLNPNRKFRLDRTCSFLSQVLFFNL